VTRVARAVDPQSRTFTIEAVVDNSHGKLRPGLFARAVLTTSKVDSVIRVPATAVISYYGVQKIYAIENGRIQERVVKLGDRSGDFIEITQGLKSGDWIAISELTRIRQGSRVQVKEEG
jgi:HlyD family secretion protein